MKRRAKKVFPLNFGILFGICMAVSSIGFKNYVWLIFLGCGFSIAAQGVAMLIMYGQDSALGWVNWAEQSINCVSQGFLMAGCCKVARKLVPGILFAG